MLKLNLGDKVLYEGRIETVVGIDRFEYYLPYLITYSQEGEGGALEQYKNEGAKYFACIEYLEGLPEDIKVRWVSSAIEESKVEKVDNGLEYIVKEESEDYILDQYKKLREGIIERIAEYTKEVYELEVEIEDIESSTKQEIKKRRQKQDEIEKQIEALKTKYFID